MNVTYNNLLGGPGSPGARKEQEERNETNESTYIHSNLGFVCMNVTLRVYCEEKVYNKVRLFICTPELVHQLVHQPRVNQPYPESFCSIR
jgi:hypothetical protein